MSYLKNTARHPTGGKTCHPVWKNLRISGKRSLNMRSMNPAAGLYLSEPRKQFYQLHIASDSEVIPNLFQYLFNH